MLRITTTYRLAETGPSYILRLTGSLQGDWVQELRRSWRVLRDAIAAVPIRVELADVECVDAASRVLLAEMRRAGVEILAGKSLGAAIVDDDGVNGPAPDTGQTLRFQPNTTFRGPLSLLVEWDT
jgi:ABC-type transporter Mla MlaB component